MNKKQAAETLKNTIVLGFDSTKDERSKHKQAIDKAIEVLSDKTEYVKRSTYRKLKALNESLQKKLDTKSIVDGKIKDTLRKSYEAEREKKHKLKEELEDLKKIFDQLAADASELKMANEKMNSQIKCQADLLLFHKTDEVKMMRDLEVQMKKNEELLDSNEQLKAENKQVRNNNNWAFVIILVLLAALNISLFTR